MNRRDYFAATAFREILTRRAAWAGLESNAIMMDRIKAIAEDSYRIADVLIDASGTELQVQGMGAFNVKTPNDESGKSEGWETRNRS